MNTQYHVTQNRHEHTANGCLIFSHMPLDTIMLCIH